MRNVKRCCFAALLAVVTLAQAQGGKLIDQAKTVPAGHDWNREVVNKMFPGGKVKYRIDSPGPISLTILTDKGYQAMLRAMKGANEKFDPTYIYMTQDFKGPKVEGSIVLRPGSHWFLMTNNLTKPAKLRLQCWMVKK